MNVLDLILKILAAASLFAVTMITIEDLKKQHRLLSNKKLIYGSIITMWITGLSLVFIEQYMSNKDKDEKHEADKEARRALTKVIEAQDYQRNAHESDEIKADKRHTEDSSNAMFRHMFDSTSYSKKTIALEDTIRVSRERTITALNKIKIPPIEPYIDAYAHEDDVINPTSDFINDTAYFTFSVQNFKDCAAKNLKFYCVFIHPEERLLYLGNLNGANRNMTLNIDQVIKMPFVAYIPDKLPNTYFIYFKMTYTDLDDKPQKPLERVFERRKSMFGKKCIDVLTDTVLDHCLNAVYNEFQFLK